MLLSLDLLLVDMYLDEMMALMLMVLLMVLLVDKLGGVEDMLLELDMLGLSLDQLHHAHVDEKGP